jgi:hypothetical protein
MENADSMRTLELHIAKTWFPETTNLESSLERCRTIFKVDWCLADFAKAQDFELELSDLFERAVALTGSGAYIQAIAAVQYVAQVWPDSGKELVQFLKTSIVRGFKQTSTSKSFSRCISVGSKATSSLYQQSLSQSANMVRSNNQWSTAEIRDLGSFFVFGSVWGANSGR